MHNQTCIEDRMTSDNWNKHTLSVAQLLSTVPLFAVKFINIADNVYSSLSS